MYCSCGNGMHVDTQWDDRDDYECDACGNRETVYLGYSRSEKDKN